MILRGWKDICKELGGVSIASARRLARDEGLPIAYIAGKPSTTKDALKAWVENRVKNNMLSPEHQMVSPARHILPSAK